MTALSLRWPQASAFLEQRGWNNLSSTMKMKCKSPPPPPYRQSPGLLTGMAGRGAVKQGRNISLCLLDNFVRGNVTMAMGGL